MFSSPLAFSSFILFAFTENCRKESFGKSRSVEATVGSRKGDMRSGNIPATVGFLRSELFPTQSGHWWTNYSTAIMFFTVLYHCGQRWHLWPDSRGVCVGGLSAYECWGWKTRQYVWACGCRGVGQCMCVCYSRASRSSRFRIILQPPAVAALGRRELLYSVCVTLKLSSNWQTGVNIDQIIFWSDYDAQGPKPLLCSRERVHWVSCEYSRGIHLNFSQLHMIKYAQKYAHKSLDSKGVCAKF